MKINAKKNLFISILICSVGLMSACGDEIPDMSEEQTEMVTEYAAGLLMKYDSTTPSRLLPEGQATAASIPHEQADNATADVSETETGEAISDAAETPGGTPIAEDSGESEPAIESGDVTVNDISDGSGAESGGFGDYITDPGISIQYSGDYEITDSYAEPGDAYFSMDASAGKKLLILHFTLTNTSGSDINVNMNDYSLRYRVSVNGGANTYILTTMMSNDILSFTGPVAAGGSQDLIAVAEISSEEAENLSTIDFTIRGDSDSTSIKLK